MNRNLQAFVNSQITPRRLRHLWCGYSYEMCHIFTTHVLQ